MARRSAFVERSSSAARKKARQPPLKLTATLRHTRQAALCEGKFGSSATERRKTGCVSVPKRFGARQVVWRLHRRRSLTTSRHVPQ
jgi:hypothetical protein